MAKDIIAKTFDYLPMDGYADNINYIRLSGNFPYYQRNIIGLAKNYNLVYVDSFGVQKEITVPLYTPTAKDTSKKSTLAVIIKKSKRQKKKERLLSLRSMVIDTTCNTAIITLNTFSGGKLRSFFRQSFKKIRKQQIKNVVLDLRSNGGGKINMSTLLTRYISHKTFKVADTSYAVARSLYPYTRYIKNKFLNNIAIFLSTHKKKDGLYHFGLWERKKYKPKTNNHFKDDLYILTNGPTFSASVLFCNVVKGQKNVTVVGEETGGGWYGNSGVIIPDITLPNTHLRVRLPLFRLVQYNHDVSKKGKGIVPDIYVGTDYEALKKGEDKKIKVVMDLIKQKSVK
ncbi:MAG: S41 family peptidase [Chitinophagaceae bacterium]|nr:S41 family peptidase [Chitinophagaceae bacterium]